MIKCLKFTAVEKGALRGFADIALSGPLLHDCALMESSGKRWLGLPGKPQLNPDRTVRTDPATGKTVYVPVVTIPDRARRELFSRTAVAAIDLFRSENPPVEVKPAVKPPMPGGKPFNDDLPW
jgi:hypothetical protein